MKYNYSLSVITPVHVGDGDSYTKKEYYLTPREDKKPIKFINRINLNTYIDNLFEEEQDKFFHDIKDENFQLKKNKFNIEKSKVYHSIENTIKKNGKLAHPTTIDSMIKNNQNKAYIPGSSIKGSIKTAITYDFLKKENNQLKKEDYNTIVKSNKIQDLMSRIIISDTTTAKNLYTIKPKSITLKGKNDKRCNDDDKKQDMYNAIECIKKDKLNLNIQLKNIKMDKIKKTLYYFSYDYIEHELNFYSKIKNSEKTIKCYEHLKKNNTEDYPLIRIGGSTGLLSTTIALHIKNNNINLYKTLFKDKDGKDVDENFPKIRKLTANNQPFGWCRLRPVE